MSIQYAIADLSAISLLREKEQSADRKQGFAGPGPWCLMRNGWHAAMVSKDPPNSTSTDYLLRFKRLLTQWNLEQVRSVKLPRLRATRRTRRFLALDLVPAGTYATLPRAALVGTEIDVRQTSIVVRARVSINKMCGWMDVALVLVHRELWHATAGRLSAAHGEPCGWSEPPVGSKFSMWCVPQRCDHRRRQPARNPLSARSWA